MPNTAAETYAARVDAVLAQRTRLRGPQPPGDLFGSLPPGHPLLTSDPRRDLDPPLAELATYIQSRDTILDVGGGAGRVGLPLALRCRELINVDPSPAMLAAFSANTERASIVNARSVASKWPPNEPLAGDVVLVNHVTYLTRDIVPFLEALEAAARRRILLTVNAPPPPSWNRVLFRLLHGEEEEVVPGHAELANVLWELGRLPDIRVLPGGGGSPYPPSPDREAAIEATMARSFRDQWATWPLPPDLAAQRRTILEARFDDLFDSTEAGLVPNWADAGREILITWQPPGST